MGTTKSHHNRRSWAFLQLLLENALNVHIVHELLLNCLPDGDP